MDTTADGYLHAGVRMMGKSQAGQQLLGIIMSARDLLGIARHARERIPKAADDRARVGSQPIVAVVFSAMSAEAFINELGWCAALALSGKPNREPAAIRNLSRELNEAERAKASTETKYQLASRILTGHAYDRERVYRELVVLIAARHALVHHKPERWVSDELNRRVALKVAPVLRKLEGRQLLWKTPTSAPNMVSLMDRIRTRAVARWAHETAERIMQSMVDVVPKSECRDLLRRAGYLTSSATGTEK